MNAESPILIDLLSTQSLFLRLVAKGSSLAAATGFVVEKSNQRLLITNWHALSGRNAETGDPLTHSGSVPDQINIRYHASRGLGFWTTRTERLHRGGQRPRWIEHPEGRTVDVVALPLEALNDEVAVYPLDLSLADADIVPEPAMPVSIIGYPLGLSTGGAWPIWKTGHIASDPDIDYQDRPAFLIDATTREGMSGSPVMLRLTSGYQRRDGIRVVAGGPTTRFLGVYSGRIHGFAEIGQVWRPRVITEILDSV